MWYTVLRLLSVGGPECGGTDYTEHIVRAATLQTSDRQQSEDSIPHAVNHSLVLLMMDIELPETF